MLLCYYRALLTEVFIHQHHSRTLVLVSYMSSLGSQIGRRCSPNSGGSIL